MIVNNINKKNLLLVCLFLLTNLVFSQDVEFKNSNFKEDKQGLKLAKENLAIADNFRKNGVRKILSMQDATVIFQQAIFKYQEAQNFNSNNAELNYKIGSSLLFTNQKQEAYSYLKKAKDFNVDLPSDFLFYYAMALQLNGDYVQAIKQFEKFSATAKRKVYELFEVLTKKYIKYQGKIKKIQNLKKTGKYNLNNISFKTINTFFVIILNFLLLRKSFTELIL